jgi:hypothetical protein
MLAGRLLIRLHGIFATTKKNHQPSAHKEEVLVLTHLNTPVGLGDNSSLCWHGDLGGTHRALWLLGCRGGESNGGRGVEVERTRASLL